MPAFDLRIFKSWQARNLAAAWVNTYVFNWDNTDVTDPSVATLINGICAMEREFHLAPVQYLHATFSTTKDEPVYDPKTLRVFELDGTGNRVIPVDDSAADLNLCLKMKKNVMYGRSGTMFYRGALLSSDIAINSRGEAELAPNAAVSNPGTISNAFGNSKVVPAMQWIMAPDAANNPDGQALTARNVVGISPSGVSINKRNHKYFDEVGAVVRAAIREAKRTGGTISFPPIVQPPALPPSGEPVNGT